MLGGLGGSASPLGNWAGFYCPAQCPERGGGEGKETTVIQPNVGSCSDPAHNPGLLPLWSNWGNVFRSYVLWNLLGKQGPGVGGGNSKENFKWNQRFNNIRIADYDVGTWFSFLILSNSLNFKFPVKWIWTTQIIIIYWSILDNIFIDKK